MRSRYRVAVLDKVTDFLLFLGKLLIVGIVGEFRKPPSQTPFVTHLLLFSLCSRLYGIDPPLGISPDVPECSSASSSGIFAFFFFSGRVKAFEDTAPHLHYYWVPILVRPPLEAGFHPSAPVVHLWFTLFTCGSPVSHLYGHLCLPCTVPVCLPCTVPVCLPCPSVCLHCLSVCLTFLSVYLTCPSLCLTCTVPVCFTCVSHLSFCTVPLCLNCTVPVCLTCPCVPVSLQTVVVGSYLIAHGFFSVYAMCVDTLFLCFCEWLPSLLREPSVPRPLGGACR